MKKTLLFCLLFVLSFSWLKADPVDTTLALTVAENFYQARMASREKSRHSIQLEYIKYAQNGTKKSLGAALYYVFTLKDGAGFIIISADNSVVPVLAYSFDGIYQNQNQAPAFQSWMENYESQMAFIKENNIMADESIDRQWENWISSEKSSPLKGLKSTGPLLKTTWNQGKYYNRFCPADTKGDDGHAYVGCVASAMGQIIKYWNYPASNNAIPKYYDSDYGTIPGVDITTYDWASMTDKLDKNSTEPAINAVATLLYHCGIAVRTDYGADGSSSNSIKTQKGFIEYFKYAPTSSCRPKNSYTDIEWNTILKNELDNGRPIWYRGDDKSVGHAFVLDGYQDDAYYHINWGWSGAYDGYFYLNDLTPGSYNWYNGQLAIIGIQPSGSNNRIEFAGYDIYDYNPGNTNGFAEPGEKILLSVRLHNASTTPIHNVSAVISSSDPDITINSSYKQLKWGDIASGIDSVKSSFVFTIKSTSTSKDAPFTLSITSDEGSWAEDFMVHITTMETIMPNAPQKLIAGNSFKYCVPLNWQEPAKKEGVIVESYNIYRNSAKIANTKRLDYVDNNAFANQTYIYRVMAVANGVESSYNSRYEVSATCNQTGIVDTISASKVIPAIDGIIKPEEWGDASPVNITNKLGYSNNPPLKDVMAYMKKVGDILYIGVRDYNDNTISINDALAIYFDNNNNNLWNEGEGNLWVVQDTTKVMVQYRKISGTYPNGLSFGTTTLNPVGVTAQLGLNNNYREYEVAIDLTKSPLKPLDNNVGMYIHSKDNASGSFNAYWPDGHVWTAPQTYADIYFPRNNKIIPQKLIAGSGFKNCIPLNWRLPSTTKSSKQKNIEPSVIRHESQLKSEKADAVVDSFTVYRKSSDDDYLSIGTTKRKDYVDTNVTVGMEYSYKIRSLVGGVESDFSNEVKASCNNTGYVQNVIITSSAPAIDGKINKAEWEDATFIDITNKLGVTSDRPAKNVFTYMKKVGDYLYLAVRDSNDATINNYDQIGIYFDNNSNKLFKTGEGNLWIMWNNSKDTIEFRGITGTYPNKLSFASVIGNPVGVVGKSGLNGGLREYELSIDLKNSTFKPVNNTVGMRLFSYDEANTGFNGYWPNGSAWPAPQTYGSITFVDALLNLSNKDLIIAAPANSTKTFDINSNTSWTVASNQTWLSLSSSSGSSNATITLTAQANPSTTTRTATITVSGSGITAQTITVTQEGAAAVLTVTPNVLSIAAPANSTKTFDIASNTSWSVASDQNWLTLSKSSGSNNTTITLTTEKNPNTTTRNAVITVSALGVSSQVITVTQDAGTTGIIDIGNSKISIYPNPAKATLFVKGLNQNSNVSILDLSGKMLINKSMTDNQIDISKLANGVYIIKIIDKNETVTGRFVKQ